MKVSSMLKKEKFAPWKLQTAVKQVPISTIPSCFSTLTHIHVYMCMYPYNAIYTCGTKCFLIIHLLTEGNSLTLKNKSRNVKLNGTSIFYVTHTYGYDDKLQKGPMNYRGTTNLTGARDMLPILMEM